MHKFTLIFAAAALACSGGSSKDDTDVNDTDVSSTDDTTTTDTDESSDTDESVDTDVAPAANAGVVGEWETTLNEGGCGIDFTQGFVGAATVDSTTAFTLTMHEGVNSTYPVFTCEMNDATTFECTTPSITSGTLETCLYQTSLSGITGTLGAGVGSITAEVAQNAVGQYCPPIPGCNGTASASANIGE